ncbi:CaiB/BaiF CoA transferase family protein [Runella slithyformis]|uniref:L-carnitine dehydratase/bile acid-inducible protein F n=1 Tax=Runella slithyformis (strain ATCC 29530 / DSM 19594 / LMG 11500 / NCIMB 11436 / LSU 4) TaxID=761193 RepID=A0A7U3ZLS6_RUNSL|nr:CoA transferase [Runella slithyformis]AEI49555.1 L-carnitine dehydratase/bile acid-inducible protein F [Runella slithyformis DSM 19594]
MTNEFFKDQLKVVELASVLAGPAVGMFFAELGAEVLKIENKKTGGDMTRSWKLPSEEAASPFSAYYASVNWNKKTYLLDLEEAHDREQAHALLRDADIVISNYRTKVAEKLGVDYATLAERNPTLIFAQLNAFDAHSERPAFDVVLQAEAGFLYMNGEADGPPVKMPVALIDVLAAHQLKEGILLALLRRTHTGKGAYVSVSLFDSAVASLANQATNWLMAGHIPQRMGTQHPTIAPYGDMYQCKDGKSIVLAAGTEKHFQQLCEVLGLSELLTETSFSTNAARVRNRVSLNSRLAEKIVHWKAESLLGKLEERSVPAAVIRTLQEVFELPAAQAMVLEEILPDGTVSKRVKTVAFEVDERSLKFIS